MNSIARLTALFTIIFILSSCGGTSNTPAPVDKRIVDKVGRDMAKLIIEKRYPIPLKPDQYIEVISKAFQKNGYSYSATLQKVAFERISFKDPEKMEFVVMLVMPELLSESDESTVPGRYYSGKDLEAVKEIIRTKDNPFRIGFKPLPMPQR